MYRAPELVSRSDHRHSYAADFYSLGIMAYEFITKEIPKQIPTKMKDPDTQELSKTMKLVRRKLNVESQTNKGSKDNINIIQLSGFHSM